MDLPNGIELRFHPDERDFPRFPDENDDRAKDNPSPCFVNKGEHKFADEVLYDCQGYQFYFLHNRAIGLGGIFQYSEALGYHRHDVEAIYVLFDKETREPRHVYYKAHGLGQGVWLSWDECLKTDDGAIIVYLALNSHATYPTSGDVARIFGFANDRVEDGGPTRKIAAENCIVGESHDLGDGIRIETEIPLLSNSNISTRERIKLPLVNDDVRNRARNQA